MEYMPKMTETERMRKVLALIHAEATATVRIRILADKGLGKFTFSPNLN